MDFFSENKVIKLLIRKFFLFKCAFIQNVDLNEFGLKRMSTIYFEDTTKQQYMKSKNSNSLNVT